MLHGVQAETTHLYNQIEKKAKIKKKKRGLVFGIHYDAGLGKNTSFQRRKEDVRYDAQFSPRFSGRERERV